MDDGAFGEEAFHDGAADAFCASYVVLAMSLVFRLVMFCVAADL